jgi:GDP-L-fucose synthase
MKIAVLGSRGFVGQNIIKHLKARHRVVAVNRDNLDLLNFYEVRDFLIANKFDVVVNAAAVMTDPISLADARNNLGLFMNFFNNSSYFGKMINLGTGAEFDRNLDITSADEELIFERMPTDGYGWGQNIKSRLCYERDNFYTIRIFNCFGAGELASRIFPRILTNMPIEVQDRYFDYFSIQDLLTVVEHAVESTWACHDINAVYPEKLMISEVVNLFYQLQNIEPNFKIISPRNNNYTGSGEKLQSLGIELQGLKQGLKEYI